MSRPILEIQADLRVAIASQAELMPDMPAMERAVAAATARATLDPAKKPDLLFAVEALEKAHARLLDQSNRNRAVLMLQQELDMANHEERMGKIKSADARVHALHQEFIASAKQACRLYEQLLIADQRASRSVPGYRGKTLPTFDFAMFLPSGWQGITSDLIRDGSLQWLNQEKDKAA